MEYIPRIKAMLHNVFTDNTTSDASRDLIEHAYKLLDELSAEMSRLESEAHDAKRKARDFEAEAHRQKHRRKFGP